jgi:flagellar basal body rod protein FlgF
MAITLVVVILIIIIERLASRTDTKKVEHKEVSNGMLESKQYFSSEEMFKRTSTARSMTVSLQTMKTVDLDMQGASAQQFLEQMYGSN